MPQKPAPDRIEHDREAVLNQLKPYFLMGYPIKTACRYANIHRSNLYYWMKTDNTIKTQINAWRGMINAKSREVVIKAIKGNEEIGVEPDVNTAKWWLERRERNVFATRVETAQSGTLGVQTIHDTTDLDDLSKTDLQNLILINQRLRKKKALREGKKDQKQSN